MDGERERRSEWLLVLSIPPLPGGGLQSNMMDMKNNKYKSIGNE